MILSNDKNIKQLDLSKELVLLDNVEMPFTSLLLQNGREKATSTIVNWDYENLDSSKGLVKEGVDVEVFQNSNRTTGDSNVCQILQKAVSTSLTTQAISQEHINDEFTHQLTLRMAELKRDLEYFLINGQKDDGTTGNARQMAGLLQFVKAENKTEVTTALDLKKLQNMAKTMKQAGTASQNLVLLCDYNTFDIVADLFQDKTTYIGVENEFGSPVQLLNLTYGRVTPYVIPDMPKDTCLMVNMDYLRIPELRPLAYYDLAMTGSSKKGFIEIENSLKVLNPNAIVQYSKKVA